MRQLNDNSQVTFHEVAGANHFSILAPVNATVASTLRADAGPTPKIAFDPMELARPFK